MDKKFGWKKDIRDERDYYHKPMFFKLNELPDKIDLSYFLPPVRDQGTVGSCVGHAVGAAICSIKKFQHQYQQWESPGWIYNGGRLLEGTLNKDAGCMPRDALEFVRKHGQLLERDWPYNESKLDTTDPLKYIKDRAITPFAPMDFVYTRVDNGLQGIMSALAEGHLVTIGTVWFETWMETNGLLPPADAKINIIGGHETLLYGYNTKEKLLLGMNSWGTDWGRGGYYLMPFEEIPIFKAVWGYDAYYMTFTAGPQPEPVKKTNCILDLFNAVKNKKKELTNGGL